MDGTVRYEAIPARAVVDPVRHRVPGSLAPKSVASVKFRPDLLPSLPARLPPRAQVDLLQGIKSEHRSNQSSRYTVTLLRF